MSATSHLTLFPELICQYNHRHGCCRHHLVYDDPLAIRLLKRNDNWWSCFFLGAFVSLISHVSGHNPAIRIVFRFSFEEAWESIDVEDPVKNIVVVELTDAHYTVTVASIGDSGIPNRLQHYDGFIRRRTTDRLDRRLATMQNLIEHAKLSRFGDWSILGRNVYIQQNDGSSCGPIAVLAVYEAITGEPFVGIQQGGQYEPWMRSALVDWYMTQYRELEVSDALHCLNGRQGTNFPVPWAPLRAHIRATINNSTSSPEPVPTTPSKLRPKRPPAIVTRSQGSRRSKRHRPIQASPPRSIRETAREKQKLSTSSKKRRSGKAFISRKLSTQNHVPASPTNLGQRLDAENESAAKRAARALVDNARHCHCDIYCKDCTDEKACPLHPGMFCSGECGRWIHAACVGHSIEESPQGQLFLVAGKRCIPLNALSQNENPWLCIKCLPARTDNTESLGSRSFSHLGNERKDLEEKWLRLGLNYSTWSEGVSLVAQRRRLQRYLDQLRDAVGDDQIVDNILDSSPNPYPTLKPMDAGTAALTARCGRRFELLQLQFVVESCRCCGRTQPVHSDKSLQTDTAFKRNHLATKYHDAYLCKCDGFCCGAQFFCKRRTKQEETYAAAHNQSYAQALEREELTLCRICDICYKDLSTDALGLELCRRFSARNGFGHIPIAMRGSLQFELDCALDAATAAEEAAIRQIVPIQSIVRLKHGNLGSRGTTTCVFQVSRVACILPNLPSECKVIVLMRHQQQGSIHIRLQSYQFERLKISRLLELLMATNHPIWKNIEISQQRLESWPVEGNLAHIAEKLVLPPEEGDESQSDSIGDMGPAPLQNVSDPAEEFVGVVPRAGAHDSAANAKEAMEACQAAGARIRDNCPLPEPELDGETAYLDQKDVLPTAGFANMRSTPYAWARAFPTVFRPVQGEDGTWRIPGDLSGGALRERQVDWSDWLEWLAWRNDGRPAIHPTLQLVLQAETLKKRLFGQVSVAISLSNAFADPEESAAELVERMKDPALANEIASKVNFFAGNVRGTTQYMAGVRRKFMATDFHHSHVDGISLRWFHTGSMAEYHDPFLRLLLSKYVAVVESPEVGEMLRHNDIIFFTKMQQYKTVVTHFFAAKTELWLIAFMSEVFGIRHAMYCYEFAKSRGAIHFHLLAYALGTPYDKLDDFLSSTALDIDDLVMALDETIRTIMVAAECTLDLNTSDGKESLSRRKEFLCRDEAGKKIWDEFVAQLGEKKQTLSRHISLVIENHFAISAMHIGHPPSEWVRPGSREALGYRATSYNMMTKQDVLDKKELRYFKFERENHLYQRRVNATNHAWSHTCSDYCWRDVKMDVQYDAAKHSLLSNRRYVDSNGKEQICIVVKLCRMGFGYKLQYPDSGDYTGGAEPVRTSSVDFDVNQQPVFVAERNHPRVVQEPLAMLHWGANADAQLFLVNQKSYQKATKDGRNYAHVLNNLHVAGVGGLEQFSCADTCVNYACGYSCKGNPNSKEYNKLYHSVAEATASKNENATVRNVNFKYVRELCQLSECSRDQAAFEQAGGQISSNTKVVKSCSLSSIPLSDLEETSSGKSFSSTNLKRKYKDRAEVYEHESLYLFAAREFNAVPQFFGHNHTVSWPLEEDYAKWQLFIHWPHRIDDFDQLMLDGSWAAGLEAVMHDTPFPRRTMAEILRRKNRWMFNSSGGAAFDLQPQSTPSGADGRENPLFDAAAAAAEASEFNGGNEADADLDEVDFAQLDHGGNDVDWTTGNDPTAKDWLRVHTTSFYANLHRTASDIGGQKTVCMVYKEDVYRPENARGFSQKLIIATTLLALKEWSPFLPPIHPILGGDGETTAVQPIPDNTQPPPCYRVYIQGNPGTGKTFVGNTQRNLVASFFGAPGFDLAVAPTGCAAALIRAKTTIRGLKIPTKRTKLYGPVTPEINGDASSVLYFSSTLQKLFSLFKDEHSMDKRPEWAWMENNCATTRRSATSPVQPLVAQRSWGGIPYVQSGGDCHQLPPVAAKTHFDCSKPANAGADAQGKLIFEQFLHPDDPQEEIGIVVVMDETFRQKDPIFKEIIHQMRHGTVTRQSAEFLLQRRLHQLPPGERAAFEQEGLFAMPTWKSTVPATVSYLQSLAAPVARIDAKYSFSKQNHAAKDVNLPRINALAAGAIVMLLTNFVVEQQLFNGAVGRVVRICYEEKEGPRNKGSHPNYVVVDFPDLTIPVEDAWDLDHPTHVPVPCVSLRCEKECCSMTTVPLRICKSITTYKTQGLTVGEEELWKKLVVQLPALGSPSPPGLEQVAISRATSLDCLAFHDLEESPLTLERLMKIGTGPAYQSRREFEDRLRGMQEQSQIVTIEKVEAMDPSLEARTFDGGYQALVQWYRESLRGRT